MKPPVIGSKGRLVQEVDSFRARGQEKTSRDTHLIRHMNANRDGDRVLRSFDQERFASFEQVGLALQLERHRERGVGLDVSHRGQKLQIAPQLGRHAHLYLEAQIRPIADDYFVTEETVHSTAAEIDELALNVDR